MSTQAAESEDEIVFETIPHSPMTNGTKSKSRKVLIPDALMYSDPEDELPRLQQRKHTHTSPALPSVDGHTKYFRRNSNQFPSVANKKLTASKRSAAAVDRSDQFKTARQAMTRS